MVTPTVSPTPDIQPASEPVAVSPPMGGVGSSSEGAVLSAHCLLGPSKHKHVRVYKASPPEAQLDSPEVDANPSPPQEV